MDPYSSNFFTAEVVPLTRDMNPKYYDRLQLLLSDTQNRWPHENMPDFVVRKPPRLNKFLSNNATNAHNENAWYSVLTNNANPDIELQETITISALSLADPTKLEDLLALTAHELGHDISNMQNANYAEDPSAQYKIEECEADHVMSMLGYGDSFIPFLTEHADELAALESQRDSALLPTSRIEAKNRITAILLTHPRPTERIAALEDTYIKSLPIEEITFNPDCTPALKHGLPDSLINEDIIQARQ